MSNSRTRTRHDKTGRSTGQFADSRFRAMNRPPSDRGWIWLCRDILESYAWRAQSASGRLIVERIGLEHIGHGGTMNGRLPVTYAQFAAQGIGNSTIRPAIAEVVALGLVQVVDPGHRAWGEFQGRSATYRLTWLPTCDGEPATDLWRRFSSLAEAREAAAAARKAIDDERAAGAEAWRQRKEERDRQRGQRGGEIVHRPRVVK
jgi:hypothetical protein